MPEGGSFHTWKDHPEVMGRAFCVPVAQSGFGMDPKQFRQR